MRYSDEHLYERPSRNGHPSWPQLLEALDRWGMRIHERIDTTQENLRSEITDVRDLVSDEIRDVRERVIGIEAQMESAPAERRPSGLLGRLKDWSELIAPLRELLMMLALLGTGIAALAQSPSAREALADIAAHLERQAAE